MKASARTVVVALIALFCWASGGGLAVADTGGPGTSMLPSATAAPPTPVEPSEPSEPAAPAGADTKQSIIIAGAGGLLLGAAIAFWQSRRHRRKYLPLDEPPSPSP